MTIAVIVGSVLSTLVSVSTLIGGLRWLNRRTTQQHDQTSVQMRYLVASARRLESGLSAAVEVFIKGPNRRE